MTPPEQDALFALAHFYEHICALAKINACALHALGVRLDRVERANEIATSAGRLAVELEELARDGAPLHGRRNER